MTDKAENSNVCNNKRHNTSTNAAGVSWC